MIENYFDVSLIRERVQRAFTGTVPAGATGAIAKRALESGAQIRKVNSGPRGCASSWHRRRMMRPPPVSPPTLAKTTLSQLGTGPYLGMYNESAEGAGSYELVIL